MTNRVFNRFGSMFSKELESKENSTIDLTQYIPSGWEVMDIVMVDGIVYITGNPIQFTTGGCQYDTRMINTNDFEVHVIKSKVTFKNSSTNEIIFDHVLPFDRILKKNQMIVSFTSTPKPVCKTNHYVEFIPFN